MPQETEAREASPRDDEIARRKELTFAQAEGSAPKLEGKANIHGSLKQGFVKIYGFTSNEQGIRHALLEKGAPDVDEADALFMIGACSAFVSYLVNKARAAGLLN